MATTAVSQAYPLGTTINERGHLVLSGSASELEEELPFWVFVDALDEYVQSVEPHRLRALDDEASAPLPELEAPAKIRLGSRLSTMWLPSTQAIGPRSPTSRAMPHEPE